MMDELIGIKIGQLPISNLRKVADLIEFDGPILSHFKDEIENNYLFYWVDNDKHSNRWLIWKINNEQLYKYLKGTESLKNILLKKNKDFIYSVEIDRDVNYNNVFAIDLKNIPKSYIPEETSTFKLMIPTIYTQFIDDFEHDGYLTLLRERALYFKLEPIDDTYSSTVAITDASDFLNKLSKSYTSYVKADFLRNFRDDFGDETVLTKFISSIADNSIPRVVELNYNSFNIGISSDFLHGSQTPKYRKWQNYILDQYKQDVIDIDYSNIDLLNELADKFNTEARKHIYGPFIEILNDKNFTLEVTNYKKTFKKRYQKVNKINRTVLIPESIPVLQDKNLKLFNVIVAMNEEQDISKISKKNINQGILFLNEVSDTEIKINKISGRNNIFELNYPIKLKLTLNSNSEFILENTEFGISVINEDKSVINHLAELQFEDNYLKIKNGSYTGSIELYNEIIMNVKPI